MSVATSGFWMSTAPEKLATAAKVPGWHVA